jgi:hypothetical protein
VGVLIQLSTIQYNTIDHPTLIPGFLLERVPSSPTLLRHINAYLDTFLPVTQFINTISINNNFTVLCALPVVLSAAQQTASLKESLKKTGNTRTKVTLRHFRVTNVAVE